ncbi:MAG: MATE family efflux transporter [Clostridiales bacterium]|nr:MATE family efflux transporter [Roseburia sp.]MDD7638513.1 MATE family efflux transporter [Clostridiales bacterium]MDY4112451.1 MATE family efflux transporter [Roseburia sp.]
MEQKNDFLGTEPIGKLLWKMSVPAIAAQLINLLYNLVDRVYIGHMPEDGALALTGVGVCMPIIMIVSAFAALISNGGAPRASMAMGKGDNDEAERILSNSFSLQVVISLILTVVLLLFNRSLLLTFGASENTIEYATAYMSVYAIGTIFVQLTLGMNAFITAQGFAKTGMLSVLIGAAFNIILDPIFIYGFNMGVRGAATATVISQAVSTIWVVSFLCGKKTIIHIRKKYLKLNPSIVLPGIALGLAPFIMQASESIIIVCFNSSLLKYGGDIAVGAMTILSSAMQFSMLPMQGLGQGAQPISSYNYGAGNGGRVKKTFKLLLISTLTYSVIVWALIMLFPEMFAMIFTSDAELIVYTKTVLRVYCAAMCIFGAQIACQMTFISLGNALASIAVAVMRKFILLLPLIYLLPHLVENKTMGVYLAEPVADVLAVTFTVILFYFQFKKALGKLECKE